MFVNTYSVFSDKAFIESFILPLSKPISLTSISWPSSRTSETFSVLSLDISDICKSPSFPGRIFTKAPNSTILTTLPLYTLFNSGSSKISSIYQPDLSRKNIGKFHQFISKNELKFIESNLSEYIYGSE